MTMSEHKRRYLAELQSASNAIRKAGAATTLFVAVTLVTAPVANADTNADTVCSTLAADPSYSGVLDAADTLSRQGLSFFAAGQVIAESVWASCPQFVPLMMRFEHAGSHAGSELS